MIRTNWVFILPILWLAIDMPVSAQSSRKGPASPLVQVNDDNDKAIDFNRARQLLRKENSGEKLTADESAYLERAKKARAKTVGSGRDKIGLKPLTEMSATDRYKGQDGGLYGKGSNDPPDEHRRAAQRLIQDQIRGEPSLNYDETRGSVKAPLLLWGPYFWADGVTPRQADKLVWERGDLAGDGTHPSPSGRTKVANMLLEFFRSHETAKVWFSR